MTTVNGLLPALSGNEKIWLFQSNVKHFSIVATLNDLLIGDVSTWYVQDHRDEVRGGDLVLLWESGEGAGLYAIGTLVGGLYEGEPVAEGGANAQWIRWRLDATLQPPVSKAELRAHHALTGMHHFDRPEAANLPVTPAQWAAIREVLEAEPGFEPVLDVISG